MSIEYIIEGNNILADFMGINRFSINFLTSWDSLMQVVEMIESNEDPVYGNFLVHISGNECMIQSSHLWKDIQGIEYEGKSYMSDPNALLRTKIESTFYNIVEFIKFYNTQILNK